MTAVRGLRVLLSAVMMLTHVALAAPADEKCHVGVYRLANDVDVDIGPGDEHRLEWQKKDGVAGQLTLRADGQWISTLGGTGRPDGQVSFGRCGSDTINFKGSTGRRIPFDVTDVKFDVEDAQLAGRLVMPKGNGRVPVVVLIHGSEHDSARDIYALQRLFPSEGIGVFVYDKRGTGGSGGEYTQNYLVLAVDAIAALREAKMLAGNRLGRLGYQGGSQGGWTAPLAASIQPVDFVIVGFGLAVSPLEEDRSAIALDMALHGYGADVLQKAMLVADATTAIINSNFQSGYDQLDAARKLYGQEPWFRYVRGDVTWFIIKTPADELRILGPKLFAGLPVHYDPMPVLRNLPTPQLWILGADDLDAPSAETASRLRHLADDGRPICVAVFPNAGHNIYEYETLPNDTRVWTRQPDGYFRMMRDFIIDGRLEPHYGKAEITGNRPSKVKF